MPGFIEVPAICVHVSFGQQQAEQSVAVVPAYEDTRVPAEFRLCVRPGTEQIGARRFLDEFFAGRQRPIHECVVHPGIRAAVQSAEQESEPRLPWIARRVVGHLGEDSPLEYELVGSVRGRRLRSGTSPGDPEYGAVDRKRGPNMNVPAFGRRAGPAAPGIPQRYRSIVHSITAVR